MKLVSDPKELASVLSLWRQAGKKIAFVPTMGNLHAGHLSLVERAASMADQVVVSIFVNPLQFGPTEDFDSYPRTFQEDCQKLQQYSVDLVFTPTQKMLYPDGPQKQTRVIVPFISDELCGASRPQFFSGVATVVSKLFHLVQPQIAIFGQKDYQQALVIQQLIRDLNFPIEFVMGETVREEDGLAMSSRNQYLSETERRKAPKLHQYLSKIVESLRVEQCKEDFLALAQRLCQESRLALENEGFSVDYLTVRHRRTLCLPSNQDTANDCVVLVAALLGKTRLIDNLLV
jgi:pantoate--beta-alanine ligase